MEKIGNFTKGILIGAGAILPGISSGVLCVIFGIYEKLLDSVLNFFKDPKKNLRFLLPITLGGMIGVILFGNVLNVLFSLFPLQTKSIFIGLILGSIPALLKEMKQKEKGKRSDWLYFFLALGLGIAMVILEKYVPITTSDQIHFSYLILCGGIMSIGVVVPGVSSTILLMLLGVYSIYLNAVAIVYLPVLIPIGIGLILGGFIMMKMTNFLLQHYYTKTFYTIIGFTLGSILVLFPTIDNEVNALISLLCMILGFLLIRKK